MMSILMIFSLSILSFAKSEFNGESCAKNKALVNGCTIPMGISFPYKEFFHPACNRHDICYACGIKFGWTRASCDSGFRENMKHLCHLKETHRLNSKNNNLLSVRDFINKLKGVVIVGTDMAKWLILKTGTLAHCLNGVDVYFNAVKHFSGPYYQKKPIPECKMMCAKVMGNPLIGILKEQKKKQLGPV